MTIPCYVKNNGSLGPSTYGNWKYKKKNMAGCHCHSSEPQNCGFTTLDLPLPKVFHGWFHLKIGTPKMKNRRSRLWRKKPLIFRWSIQVQLQGCCCFPPFRSRGEGRSSCEAFHARGTGSQRWGDCTGAGGKVGETQRIIGGGTGEMQNDGRKFHKTGYLSVVSWNRGMKITSVLSVVPCPIKT